LLPIVLGGLTLLEAGGTSVAEDQSKCCGLPREALKVSGEIKSGMIRRQVELNFRSDGGMQVRDVTRYVYRSCDYIRVDVHFKLAKPVNSIKELPDDIVTEVSTPYLAHPTMD
jgi:hypothetical protein